MLVPLSSPPPPALLSVNLPASMCGSRSVLSSVSGFSCGASGFQAPLWLSRQPSGLPRRDTSLDLLAGCRAFWGSLLSAGSDAAGLRWIRVLTLGVQAQQGRAARSGSSVCQRQTICLSVGGGGELLRGRCTVLHPVGWGAARRGPAAQASVPGVSWRCGSAFPSDWWFGHLPCIYLHDRLFPLECSWGACGDCV